MSLQKKDFIEIEFTAKIKDGEVFDSTKKEELQKLNSKAKAAPFIYSLGEEMFLDGVDNFLIGKDIGEYKIELPAEKAFGKRDSKQIQMIPMKVFKQHQVNPIPGAMLNFDNKPAKILTVSGGRVMVDFNNPLAGKDVVYEIKILRKVDDQNEQIKALNEFLFKKDFKFNVKENKLILEVEPSYKKFVEMFKEKYKEILGLDLEVKEPEEKDDKKESSKVEEKVEDKNKDNL